MQLIDTKYDHSGRVLCCASTIDDDRRSTLMITADSNSVCKLWTFPIEDDRSLSTTMTVVRPSVTTISELHDSTMIVGYAFVPHSFFNMSICIQRWYRIINRQSYANNRIASITYEISIVSMFALCYDRDNSQRRCIYCNSIRRWYNCYVESTHINADCIDRCAFADCCRRIVNRSINHRSMGWHYC